jgi:hypothetical protein
VLQHPLVAGDDHRIGTSREDRLNYTVFVNGLCKRVEPSVANPSRIGWIWPEQVDSD